jgi:VWFA-related protein
LLPFGALLILLLAATSSAAPQTSGQPEVEVHQTTPAFRLRSERNLVTLRVVVRDANGKTVGNLHKDDFRLLDNGQPQEVSGFTVESLSPEEAANQPVSSGMAQRGITTPAKAPVAPQRFVGLFFDDFHLTAEGIGRTRNAAWKYVTTAIRPQDRVAIFTATGKGQLDFTGDRKKLHQALYRLAPRPRTAQGCPEVDEYEAYLADQLHEPIALAILHDAAVRCVCGLTDSSIDPPFEQPASSMSIPGVSSAGQDPTRSTNPCPAEAKRISEAHAAEVWTQTRLESQYALEGLQVSARRLAAMPGQRTLVLVSPGFLTETLSGKIDDLINWALRQDIVISAVDSAGLAPDDQPDLADMGRPDLGSRLAVMHQTGLITSRDVLASLANGTGGDFFHNNNDFHEGFRQAAAIPESYYVLSFSPTDFKPDGKFHKLEVSLNSSEPLKVEARRGYFATETALSGPSSTPTKLEQTVFSQDEVHGLPADVTTQVEKLKNRESEVTVIIHVDLRSLTFRREANRNVNTLVFDTALFDHDGKYMMGKEASLELRYKDATLEKLSQSGINAKASFQVPPGTYRVREVVRDKESNSFSALNCNVQALAP